MQLKLCQGYQKVDVFWNQCYVFCNEPEIYGLRIDKSCLGNNSLCLAKSRSMLAYTITLAYFSGQWVVKGVNFYDLRMVILLVLLCNKWLEVKLHKLLITWAEKVSKYLWISSNFADTEFTKVRWQSNLQIYHALYLCFLLAPSGIKDMKK